MTPDVPEVVTKILAARGYTPDEAAAFLAPSYDEHLHDPFLLTDMEPAVERILEAAEAGERVAVYGDYDIDGITASGVMLETLASLGIAAESYIPDRFEEGYGINQAALAKLKDDGFGLVISVDCGITSVAEAAWAQSNGLDLIITDHHSAPPELPRAIAMINPKRPGDNYPFKDLAGVGVAFKLAQALQQRSGKPEPGQEKWLLDLVALGTVCDVVPLVGENRVLASYGLKVMRRTRRPGLRALAAVGGIEIGRIDSGHLGFVLGPRLNAAGRLEHAARSLELVRTADAERAVVIAGELDRLNQERRATQAKVLKEADAMAADYANDGVLVLAYPEWNHGIVGIVASKLVEKWHKPTVVLQVMGETTKGSARSTGQFNMVDGLRAVDRHLTKYGGHYYAAGATLPTANLEAFRRDLNAYFRDEGHQHSERPVAEAEVTLGSLAEANWELLHGLELLQPYGTDNPQPLLGLTGLTITRVDRMGSDRSHYRLQLMDSAGNHGEAVGFGLVERFPGLASGQRVGLCLRLNKNEWQGRERLQLHLVELIIEVNDGP
jgi:single-stranded-DNA-specific exonuclease